MAEPEIEILVGRWIAFQEAFIRRSDSTVTPELDEASDAVLHMPFDDPERTWQFIEAVLVRCSDERILGNLAAGPIEDLLCQHGEQFIKRFEDLASKNQRFRSLLREVWKGEMSDEIWARLQRIRGPSMG